MDVSDHREMYLLGRFDNVGSVIKIKKSNGNVRWKADFTNYLTHITAEYQDNNDEHIYGCGYDTTNGWAGLFRLKANSVLKWFITI